MPAGTRASCAEVGTPLDADQFAGFSQLFPEGVSNRPSQLLSSRPVPGSVEVMNRLLAGPVPQKFCAATLILPLTELGVTIMEGEAELPVQPAGNVQT